MSTTVSPADTGELVSTLRQATAEGMAVEVRGGGSRSGYGSPPPPDVVISMSELDRILVWEPDDLTLVVGAGARVADLEQRLAEKGQTLVMPEVPGPSTVGGVIASGVSSLRRARLYPTRERILETTVVTGDGRVVRSGGRVVKNVTGYDLSRLHFGAFGSLGVLVSVCLKLWPSPPAAATIDIDEPAQAGVVTRPLAVLQDRQRTRLFIWGTQREVSSVVAQFPGRSAPGLEWPGDPGGRFRWSLRVPPGLTGEAVGRIPSNWDFLAIHGVGEVRLGSDDMLGAPDLRHWAESVGGHLVVVQAPPGGIEGLDPWGSPPAGLELQRRLIGQFDPGRVINRGRLPGGI